MTTGHDFNPLDPMVADFFQPLTQTSFSLSAWGNPAEDDTDKEEEGEGVDACGWLEVSEKKTTTPLSPSLEKTSNTPPLPNTAVAQGNFTAHLTTHHYKWFKTDFAC
jgi:hypothetical protein